MKNVVLVVQEQDLHQDKVDIYVNSVLFKEKTFAASFIDLAGWMKGELFQITKLVVLKKENPVLANAPKSLSDITSDMILSSTRYM